MPIQQYILAYLTSLLGDIVELLDLQDRHQILKLICACVWYQVNLHHTLCQTCLFYKHCKQFRLDLDHIFLTGLFYKHCKQFRLDLVQIFQQSVRQMAYFYSKAQSEILAYFSSQIRTQCWPWRNISHVVILHSNQTMQDELRVRGHNKERPNLNAFEYSW